MALTRGLRNNNPLNIRKGNDWQGETKGSDPSFETFQSMAYGYRAAIKILYKKNQAMKKLLIVCAVLLLCGCRTVKDMGNSSLYKKEFQENNITMSDYDFLMNGDKELHNMRLLWLNLKK